MYVCRPTDIPASQLYHVQGQLDSLLGRKRPCCDEAHMEEASVRALNAFDELRRDLRALTQLPLDISAVYGNNTHHMPVVYVVTTPAQSLTHPVTHAPMHSHPCNNSFIRVSTHPLAPTFTYALTHSVIHSLTHSCIHFLSQAPTKPLTYLVTHSSPTFFRRATPSPAAVHQRRLL